MITFVVGNSLSSAELSCFIYGLAKPADQGSVSLKSRRPFGPEKPFVKLQPAYSEEMVFSGVVKGIKIKVTAKFLASRCLRCEDTKRIMLPKMGLKCFGIFEKQDQVLKSSKHLLLRCRHQSWCEPVSVDRNRHYCFFPKVIFSVIVTGKRLRGLGPVCRKSRNFSGAFRVT